MIHADLNNEGCLSFHSKGFSGKVSQPSGKILHATENILQQVGKGSQQTGKFSQHPFGMK